MKNSKRGKQYSCSGFTLMELVLVILLVSILSFVVIPKATNLLDSSREVATQKEMREIQRAVLGDPDTGLIGYQDNMAALPSALADLHTNPAVAGYTTYDAYTQLGWNGPYVDSRDLDGGGTPDIEEDAWGNAYVYNAGAGTVTSWGPDEAGGGGDDIVVD